MSKCKPVYEIGPQVRGYPYTDANKVFRKKMPCVNCKKSIKTVNNTAMGVF